MLLQGLVIMVVGVGMVVGFLGLLVGILLLNAKIIPRFNHILPDEPPKSRAQRARAHHVHETSDADIAVAIAAVSAHRRDPGKG